MGSLLVVTNQLTQDEQECLVMYPGADSDKGRHVGIEFLAPFPHFWGIEICASGLDSPARLLPAKPTQSFVRLTGFPTAHSMPLRSRCYTCPSRNIYNYLPSLLGDRGWSADFCN